MSLWKVPVEVEVEADSPAAAKRIVRDLLDSVDLTDDPTLRIERSATDRIVDNAIAGARKVRRRDLGQ